MPTYVISVTYKVRQSHPSELWNVGLHQKLRIFYSISLYLPNASSIHCSHIELASLTSSNSNAYLCHLCDIENTLKSPKWALECWVQSESPIFLFAFTLFSKASLFQHTARFARFFRFECLPKSSLWLEVGMPMKFSSPGNGEFRGCHIFPRGSPGWGILLYGWITKPRKWMNFTLVKL